MQVLSGILAEEWQSEGCSTVVASKLEIQAAGSQSQTETTPKPPLVQSAAQPLHSHGGIAAKPEPVTQAHHDGMHEDLCTPVDTRKDASNRVSQHIATSKVESEGSPDVVTRAESSMSSGENAGNDGGPDEVGFQGGLTSQLQGTLQHVRVPSCLNQG